RLLSLPHGKRPSDGLISPPEWEGPAPGNRRRRTGGGGFRHCGPGGHCWGNRTGAADGIGFCSKTEHQRLLQILPAFEMHVVDDGILLVKFWLEVSDAEQKRRFAARINDPLRQWKLSPTDLCSRSRWFEYSRARDSMLEATDTEYALTANTVPQLGYFSL